MNYIVYFDLETGGVQPQHPTIQLAAVAIDEATRQEVAGFECKIAFNEADCDQEALAMNHYVAADWAQAVSPAAAAAKFAAWLKPYSSVEMISKRTGKPYRVAKLAGYNAVGFDLPRLRALFGTAFFPCSYLVRDVLQRAFFYFDERPTIQPPENFKLATVCARFEVAIEGAHDALADARMCAALAARLGASEANPLKARET